MDDCHLIFVHGLAKKPPPDELAEIWVDSLDRDDPHPEVFGYGNAGLSVQMKAAHTLVYYADVFHGTDYETDLASYNEAVDNPSFIEGVPRDPRGMVRATLPSPADETEARFVQRLSSRLGLDGAGTDLDSPSPGKVARVESGEEAYALERVPLPLGVKKEIIKSIAMEAYYYLFDKDYTRSDGQVFPARRTLQDRLVTAIAKVRGNSRKVVVVSHSMGTMLAYDCLRNRADCAPVDGLITLGTPLGLDEVYARLKASGQATVDFPAEKLRGDWVNVYDRLDIVCGIAPCLASIYRCGGQPAVIDVNEQNWGEWRHNIAHYLRGPKLRAQVRRLGGL